MAMTTPILRAMSQVRIGKPAEPPKICPGQQQSQSQSQSQRQPLDAEQAGEPAGAREALVVPMMINTSQDFWYARDGNETRLSRAAGPPAAEARL